MSAIGYVTLCGRRFSGVDTYRTASPASSAFWMDVWSSDRWYFSFARVQTRFKISRIPKFVKVSRPRMTLL